MTYEEYNSKNVLEWHKMDEEPIAKDSKIWFIFGNKACSKIRVETWNKMKLFPNFSKIYAWAYPITPKF